MKSGNEYELKTVCVQCWYSSSLVWEFDSPVSSNGSLAFVGECFSGSVLNVGLCYQAP